VPGRNESRQRRELGLAIRLIPHPAGLPQQDRVLVPGHQQFSILSQAAPPPSVLLNTQVSCTIEDSSGTGTGRAPERNASTCKHSLAAVPPRQALRKLSVLADADLLTALDDADMTPAALLTSPLTHPYPRVLRLGSAGALVDQRTS
jgi:hypothetical protein